MLDELTKSLYLWFLLTALRFRFGKLDEPYFGPTGLESGLKFCMTNTYVPLAPARMLIVEADEDLGLLCLAKTMLPGIFIAGAWSGLLIDPYLKELFAQELLTFKHVLEFATKGCKRRLFPFKRDTVVAST